MRLRAVHLFLLALLLVPTTTAHVTVIPGAGDSSENATALGSPPARVFDALHPAGGYHYYRVMLDQGEVVHVRLLAAPGAFILTEPPTIVFVSPLLNDSGFRPVALPLPEGAAVDAVFGRSDPPTVLDWRYPARFVAFVDHPFVAPATGNYDIVVYSREGGGAFSLAVERAGGSPLLDAYLIVSDRTGVYAWSGESGWAMATGFALGGGVVIALAAWQWRRGERFSGVAKGGALVSSVLFGATASSLAWEAARVGLDARTLGLAATSAALAAVTLFAATRPGPPSWRTRAAVIAAGVLGLASWSGALIGPALAILTSLLPEEEEADESAAE